MLLDLLLQLDVFLYEPVTDLLVPLDLHSSIILSTLEEGTILMQLQILFLRLLMLLLDMALSTQCRLQDCVCQVLPEDLLVECLEEVSIQLIVHPHSTVLVLECAILKLHQVEHDL